MSRITGLATGLDVDALVEETMNAYQTKIDVVDQQMKLAELQQELYRGVISSCRDFYDSYFDISKSDSILLEKNWISTSFECSSSAVTVTGNSSAEAGNYSVKVTQLATSAQGKVDKEDFEKIYEIDIAGVSIDLSECKSNSEKVSKINSALKSKDITVKYSEFEGGLIISTKDSGSGSSTKLGEVNYTTQKNILTKSKDELNESVNLGAENLIIDFTDVKDVKSVIEKFKEEKKDELKKAGITIEYSETDGLIVNQKEEPSKEVNVIDGNDFEGSISNGNNTIEFNESNPLKSNSFTIDGVTFKFNDVTKEESVNVVGKTNVTNLKDNIVKFVNDYNTLMEKLNTLINEERDSDYMPLTDAQKEEMTESQIELWEKKVTTGQLRRDSDLTRIRNAMKAAMSNLVGDSKNTLSSFGINSVSDYGGNKNGTFTIDETALTEALENNFEDVKSLFISKASSTVTDKDKIYAANGTLYRLKNIFDSETQNSSGSLLKKAGMEGSSTSSNNTLSKKIAKYEEKIERMESLFATKQQALYTKYARLETLMNNLNSQQSYLSSMFSS